MPELPDVEGFRRFFAAHAQGKTVRALHADPTIVRNSSPQGLGRSLSGASLHEARRHGKWLICPTDRESALLLHFGMTGELVWARDPSDTHPHDRLTLTLDDGELRYRSMRKLGGAWLKRREERFEDVVGPLGPDADHITVEDLIEILDGRRGSLKSALMDQRFIAGLGNLTVDEILWHARVAPRRRANDLSENEIEKLHQSLREVLRASKRAGRVPAKEGWVTRARAEKEPKCPRCSRSLAREQIAGRTTYWCRSCQD